MAVVTEQIIASFTKAGIPAVGLSPTVRIRELSGNTLVVTDAAMVEVGDGFYSYDFTAYDTVVNYAIRCDGTSVLSNAERYSWVGNEDYDEDTADTLLKAPVEGGTTFAEFIRIIMSVLVGKSTATQNPGRVAYRDLADAKDRAVVLHSNDGDRTDVTLDGSE